MHPDVLYTVCKHTYREFIMWPAINTGLRFFGYCILNAFLSLAFFLVFVYCSAGWLVWCKFCALANMCLRCTKSRRRVLRSEFCLQSAFLSLSWWVQQTLSAMRTICLYVVCTKCYTRCAPYNPGECLDNTHETEEKNETTYRITTIDSSQAKLRYNVLLFGNNRWRRLYHISVWMLLLLVGRCQATSRVVLFLCKNVNVWVCYRWKKT